MAQPANEKDRVWGTGVECECGEEIYCYNTYISPKRVYYGYLCKECKISGSWPELARRRISQRTSH